MSQEAIERTKEWERRFRASAAEMPELPPGDIDPIIWKAQREALISQADDLAAEADCLEYGHCCCGNVICCDCGKTIPPPLPKGSPHD